MRPVIAGGEIEERMPFSLDKIRQLYQGLPQALEQVAAHLQRPLTLTEKLIYIHSTKQQDRSLACLPDQVCLHDAAAQIVLLQYALSGKKAPAVATAVHCDRLICAEKGAKHDLAQAIQDNQEIFNFLKSACSRFGADFWQPGAGILHQVQLEHYAFPGGLLLATDHQASYVGGLGMLAFGKGSLEALEAMLGQPFEISMPRVIGVYLTGELQSWASPKDLILKLMPQLVAKGAKGAVIEYFGPGAQSLSCTGKGTICSMACELEALSAIFPYDPSMSDYLTATGRKEIAAIVDPLSNYLQADAAVLQDPYRQYSEVIEIDLKDIHPHIKGPYTLPRAIPVHELGDVVQQYGYPDKISMALIGSTTNSSYEDLQNAAQIARHALKHGLKVKAPLMISPGSEQVRSALMSEGHWQVLEDVGALPLASACGPCIGQWKRHDVAFGEKNSIISSYSCTASGHHDNNPNTQAFIGSPAMVMALALAGSLDYNPLEDAIMNPQGLPVRLAAPKNEALPASGFTTLAGGYLPPGHEGGAAPIAIDPASERIQVLEPFKTPQEKGFCDLRLLVKIAGKCSIDQILPLSKWQKYRGHLDNLSNSLFSHAPNRLREEVGKGKNLLTGSIEPLAKLARDYKKEDIGWIAVGYEQCGEGAGGEFAALAIRHLGARAFIANSFSPDFEHYLKKQGVLALSFTWPTDVDQIREDDLMDLIGLGQLSEGSVLELLLKHADGTTDRLTLSHTFTEEQLAWFKAGSALNAFALV